MRLGLSWPAGIKVLPRLQIVSAVFSLRSVRGAGFTQTAVRTKPRLKTDLMSTHPPAAKPMKATSSCGSSLDKDARSPPPSSFTPTCQLTVEEHAFHVESCVRFWSMSSVVGPTATLTVNSAPRQSASLESCVRTSSLCVFEIVFSPLVPLLVMTTGCR